MVIAPSTTQAYMTEIKLAAIDIGSNAIRMQVSVVLFNEDGYVLKKLEYLRFPLRLGEDVFETGRISKRQEERFIKLLKALSLIIELYEVQGVMACATSAMRDASNGTDLVVRTRNETGIGIRIIGGQEEATLIARSLIPIIDDHYYLHIDVGGGSTELNLYAHKKLLASASFQAGSVRNAIHPHEAYFQMENWMKNQIKTGYHPLIAIGTGGNIGKFYELVATDRRKTRKMTYTELKETHSMVEKLSVEQRVNDLMLNPDRADTIIPAGNIYLHIMEVGHIKKILVPDLGLKDGLLLTLLDQYLDKHPELKGKMRLG